MIFLFFYLHLVSLAFIDLHWKGSWEGLAGFSPRPGRLNRLGRPRAVGGDFDCTYVPHAERVNHRF
jgi:hypothetical protein